MTFDEFLDEWRGCAPIITARTSGSTGQPKLIELRKEFVRDSGLRTNSFFNITPSSRLHSCVAADFIGGKMMAVRSELAGCAFTWEIPSNAPLGGLKREDHIDLLAVVPSQMLYIVEHYESMPDIGAVIIGGSAIHPSLRDKIIRSGVNAYETYGMTETASHIALCKIKEGESWFTTLDGITVALDDRECLVIRFSTGETFVTNDLAYIDNKGCFKILGRYDNMIITGGKKVSPEKLEKIISPIVERECVVCGRSDEKWGERLVLKIEGPKGDETELRNILKGILQPYEVPKEIEWVEKLERTSNGKIKRINSL